MFIIKGDNLSDEVQKELVELIQKIGAGGMGKVIECDEDFTFIAEYEESDGCKIHNRPIAGYVDAKNTILNERMWPFIEGIKKNYPELDFISTRRIMFVNDFEWERKENSNENSAWKIALQKAPKMIQDLCGIDYIIRTRTHYINYMTEGQIAAMLMAELLRIDKETGAIKKLTSESYSPFTSTFGSKWLEKGAKILKDVSKERVELAGIPTADGQQSMYKMLDIEQPEESEE